MATLSSYVQDAYDSNLLIQLTNPDASASTINTTVLDEAIESAEGAFRTEVGQAPDPDNDYMKGPLLVGVLYFLYMFKGRSAALVKYYGDQFYARLKALRRRAGVLSATNSGYDPSKEEVGDKPDMDREGPLSTLHQPDTLTWLNRFSPDNDET